MTAYEEAARQVEVSGGVAVVAPAPQEPVRRPLMPVSIDAVDDNEPEVPADIHELGYVAPVVAGVDDGELADEDDEITEVDVADEPEQEEEVESAA
jgi:hypothetical protein